MLPSEATPAAHMVVHGVVRASQEVRSVTGVPEGDERSWREARLHLSLLAECVLNEGAASDT